MSSRREDLNANIEIIRTTGYKGTDMREAIASAIELSTDIMVEDIDEAKEIIEHMSFIEASVIPIVGKPNHYTLVLDTTQS